MLSKIWHKKEVYTEVVELQETNQNNDKVDSGSSNEEKSSLLQFQPEPRRANGDSGLSDTLFDVSLIAIPLLLLTKTVLCIFCYNFDQANRGETVDQASRLTLLVIELNGQMVTVFTILFIVIISTLTKRYALYKAQQGAYISELEQLQSSVSMTSTFKMIWKLRAWTWKSAALVFIWAFYYIGSQASKREFGLSDSDNPVTIRGLTVNFDAPTGLPSSNINALSGMNALSNQTLINANSYFKGAAKDMSDNWQKAVTGDDRRMPRGSSIVAPLVPSLQYATQPDYLDLTANDPYAYFSKLFPVSRTEKKNIITPSALRGWYDVSRQSANLFTSFLGRLLILEDTTDPSSLAATTNATIGSYQYESGYFNVKCDGPVFLQFNEFPNGTSDNSSISLNMTVADNPPITDQKGNTLRYFDFWYRSPAGDAYPCIKAFSLRSKCNITSTRVEAVSQCRTNGCVTTKIRYQNGLNEANATSYSTLFDDDQTAAAFFSNILNSTGPARDVFAGYGLTDFASYIGLGAYGQAMSGTLSSLTDAQNCTWDSSAFTNNLQDTSTLISTRLAILFTSYLEAIQLSQSQFYIPSMAFHKDIGDDSKFYAAIYKNVTFKGNFYEPGYYLYWQWIGLDIASCLLLLWAGVVCIILRSKTLAPDIFGFVSSLTIDNPHLGLPEVASTYSGIERAQLLKDVKIKIGDVHAINSQTQEGENQFGKIGIVRADASSLQAGELRRGRRYI